MNYSQNKELIDVRNKIRSQLNGIRPELNSLIDNQIENLSFRGIEVNVNNTSLINDLDSKFDENFDMVFIKGKKGLKISNTHNLLCVYCFSGKIKITNKKILQENEISKCEFNEDILFRTDSYVAIKFKKVR
jgi:predicted  nucleic acid-binding Zn-ribbon protein